MRPYLLDACCRLHEVPLTVGLAGEHLGIRDDEADRTHLRTSMSVTLSTVGSPPPLGLPPTPHRPRIMVFIIALAVCWSCSGDATDVPADTVERDVFIGAYVDLRVTALSSGTTEIEADARDSILAAYGVTGEELTQFVDTYGENVESMRDLWTEIEGQLAERLEQNARDEEDEALEED